jgi:pilus assembly protein CpaB
MKRGRLVIYLVIILVIVVVLIGVFMLSKGGGIGGKPKVTDTPLPPTPTEVSTIDVWMMAQPVARGDLVTAGAIMTATIPLDYYNDQIYIVDKAEVENKLARVDLYPQMFLTRSMLADSLVEEQTGSDAAMLVDPGMVAISIPITRLSSVSYAPQRGDHVNVIVTLLLIDLDQGFQSALPNYSIGVYAPGPLDTERRLNAEASDGLAPMGRAETDPTLEQTFYVIPSESQRPKLVSQTLLQNIKVLQVGEFKEEKAELPKMKTAEPTWNPTLPLPTATNTPTPTPTPAIQPTTTPVPPPDIITLIVKPEEAVALNYLLYSGAEITLALRPPRDDSRVSHEAVTLEYLMRVYNIPNPPDMAVGIEPRIDDLIAPSLPNDYRPATPVP